MLMMHRKRRISKESIIVIMGTLVILAGVIFFNFERINLFLKGYSFSEQSIILNLGDETVKRFLNSSALIDIKSVSYTHLDVYKRQILLFNLWGKSNSNG